MGRAARLAGLEDSDWPPLRFHDLRHTFASHLIIDLALDVAQVSRILGHAQVTTTLNIYTHLFDDARHACDIRGRMAASAFARLLEPEQDGGNLIVLPRPSTLQGRHHSARSGGLLDQNLTALPRRPPTDPADSTKTRRFAAGFQWS